MADIVVLLGYNDYNARGAVLDVDSSPENAYAICQVGSSADKYTFAHEIGHIFGGGHEDDFTNVVSYAHGKQFDVNNWPFVYRYSTLMHTWPNNANYLRILNFSNPSVSVDGVSTGDANADVARRIRERAGAVSSFRAGPEVLTASVDGPSLVRPSQLNSWETVYGCGQGPYSFEWTSSNDGFNYGGVISNSEIFSTNIYDNPTYLRVKVTSSDGQQAFGFKTVYIREDAPRLAAISLEDNTKSGITQIRRECLR
jgi:hypothetical protein